MITVDDATYEKLLEVLNETDQDDRGTGEKLAELLNGPTIF